MAKLRSSLVEVLHPAARAGTELIGEGRHPRKMCRQHFGGAQPAQRSDSNEPLPRNPFIQKPELAAAESSRRVSAGHEAAHPIQPEQPTSSDSETAKKFEEP